MASFDRESGKGMSPILAPSSDSRQYASSVMARIRHRAGLAANAATDTLLNRNRERGHAAYSNGGVASLGYPAVAVEVAKVCFDETTF
jgi:hypothetical protein